MATTTMNLPCVRFVKRVNNGALGSKYSYIAMMAENAKALESAKWHEATVPLQNVTMPVNKVTETDAEYDESGAMTSAPRFSAFMSDGFDCYQQGGDARKEDGTMCGYAGCVAYRFKIPTSAASVALSSVALAIQRDRYCRAGVRVALVLSNNATPSDSWAVVRGEGSGAIVSASTASTSLGVSSWGFLGQTNVQNLISGRAADGTITFNASGEGGFAALATTGRAYLWVYLTLEDYQSYWTMYNAKEARYYSIEGSAVLVASRAAFTFGGTVTADADETFHVAYAERDSASTNFGGTSFGAQEHGIFTIPAGAATCCRTVIVKRHDTKNDYTNPFPAVWEDLLNAIQARFRGGQGDVSNDPVEYSDASNSAEQVVTSPWAKLTKTGSEAGDLFSLKYEVHPRVKVFATPRDFAASIISILFNKRGQVGSTCAEMLVWLKRDAIVPVVTETMIKNNGFYTGFNTVCDGFELLGKLDKNLTVQTTEFRLSKPLARQSVATLFFVPNVIINPSQISDGDEWWSGCQCKTNSRGTQNFSLDLKR